MVMNEAPPVPAATLILLRDIHPGPPEMLMIQREQGMVFAAGAWVWPGGRVDPADHHPGHGSADDAHRIAALRETREEVGLDLAGLSPDALIPFARWLPKLLVPRRFDTIFFLARAPEPEARLLLQPGEVAAAKWVRAEAMLEKISRGEAGAIFPTKCNLERMAQHNSIDAAFADARAFPVEPITPWVEDRADGPHVVIAEGIGYPVTSEPLTTATRA